MTIEEREKLQTAIDNLAEIQADAPTKTTYSRGRTDSSISSKLLSVLDDLRGLVDDTATTTAKTKK